MHLSVVLVLSALLGAPTPVSSPAPRPSGGCSATSIEAGRRLERTIRVDGVERTYLLDVPETIQPQRPVPLLFDFHGFQHSAAGVWKVSEFKDLAARDGFITVYPQGLSVDLLGTSGPGWEMFRIDGNRDIAFTRAVLDQLERTYCIDRARVYATGFSNGGFFSNVLACTMSDRFAAIAPVGSGAITVACQPARGVPVLIFHGRTDTLVPVERARAARDAWVEKNQCQEHASNGCEWHRSCRDGVEVRYCESDVGHTWPPGATVQIWEFFKAHPMKE
jgi:polyhydroxybutyrate depolymerase